MGIFEKISAGIRKTRDSIMGGLARLVNSFTKIDEDFFDELEETLIMCDIGVETSEDICAKLRKKVKEQGLTRPADIIPALKDIIADMLGEDKKLDLSTKPSVILVIGVNGAGKTTTIGKLAAKLKNDGNKVIVAAADTFRAAAIDQLEVWTERAGVDIVKHSEGSDPASVVFDAVAAAKARGADVVICDTAGRLHNKKNLMDELRKITRICYQQAEGCSIETLLVLDATTGQNAVNQARLFGETANITGIVLTKLDGTAKGGIIISIHRELGIPVKLVGVGEKIDDLQEFSAHDFAEALFEKETDFEGNYDRLTDTDEEAPEEIAEGSSDADILDDLPAEEPEEIPEDIPEELPEEEEEELPEEDIPEEEPAAEDDGGYTDESEEDTPEDEDAAPETEETPAESGKKDLRNGRFGFLFKEITFGRKKKKDTAEDTDNNESEE
ncbi:MAG: signal recognition particle-docking protein FtsY [Oscillospiraceae bacterium]|nr:signal recognition particle-docking protein FtsY [Oscillospiraceae bacterium]